MLKQSSANQIVEKVVEVMNCDVKKGRFLCSVHSDDEKDEAIANPKDEITLFYLCTIGTMPFIPWSAAIKYGRCEDEMLWNIEKMEGTLIVGDLKVEHTLEELDSICEEIENSLRQAFRYIDDSLKKKARTRR